MSPTNQAGEQPEQARSEAPVSADAPSPTLREAFRAWCKVAALSFGGPAGQIAVMHRILVDEKRWISEERFLHALNYCMLLPGPEAQQLATYIGWLLHRTIGGLMAGILFVLPGFVSILLLSVLYAGYQDMTFVQGLFFGLKPAVLAVVVQAVLRIGRKVLVNRVMIGLAVMSFVAIFFFQVSFPWIIIAAGIVGYIGGRLKPETFHVIRGHSPGAKGKAPAIDQEEPGDPASRRPASGAPATAGAPTTAGQPLLGRALRVTSVCLVLWFAPLIVLAITLGTGSVFVTEGVFFSKAAVVTFGGAYAVLGYLAQETVNTYGWLQPGEMLDGLGMAETTPGPLIQVVQFVGFMGAYRNPGSLDPMLAGVLGSILTTWVTFVPCFLWIFLGAPYVERLRGNRALSAALSGITAAVVGVILNLALWFGLHTLFATVDETHTTGMRVLMPEWGSLQPATLLIAAAAALALFRFKIGMLPTLFGSTAVGCLYHVLAR